MKKTFCFVAVLVFGSLLWADGERLPARMERWMHKADAMLDRAERAQPAETLPLLWKAREFASAVMIDETMRGQRLSMTQKKAVRVWFATVNDRIKWISDHRKTSLTERTR